LTHNTKKGPTSNPTGKWGFPAVARGLLENKKSKKKTWEKKRGNKEKRRCSSETKKGGNLKGWDHSKRGRESGKEGSNKRKKKDKQEGAAKKSTIPEASSPKRGGDNTLMGNKRGGIEDQKGIKTKWLLMPTNREEKEQTPQKMEGKSYEKRPYWGGEYRTKGTEGLRKPVDATKTRKKVKEK